MSDYLTVLRWLGKRLGPKQYRAFAYLERNGKRFLVDFGYENAIEKAREHWRNRRSKQKETR